MNEEINKLIEEFEARLQELKEEYEEFKIGDVIWVVGSNGEVDDYRWTNDNFDNTALKNNALFKTKEEAEFEAERLKVLRESGKLGRAFKPCECNFFITCYYGNDYDGDLEIDSTVRFDRVYGNHYFDTEDEAKKAVEKIGEERIKKYLFNVEG